MEENIQAATRLCRSLEKSRMLSRKWNNLQHGLTIDLYHWNSSCLLLVQSSKWKVTCKEQELLPSRWSLPGDIGRGRAGEAELSESGTCTDSYSDSPLLVIETSVLLWECTKGSRGSTSDKALCTHWRGQKLPQESLLGPLSLDLSLVSCSHGKDRFGLF